MGFLQRIATIFGFLKYDAHSAAAEENKSRAGRSGSRRPTRAFGGQVPVGPIFVPCSFGEGGVQGFSWYSQRLRVDDDGDVADEFLDQVSSSLSFGLQEQTAHSRFEVKYTTKPALVKRQAIAINGNVHPCMEYHGMLRWV